MKTARTRLTWMITAFVFLFFGLWGTTLRAENYKHDDFLLTSVTKVNSSWSGYAANESFYFTADGQTKKWKVSYGIFGTAGSAYTPGTHLILGANDKNSESCKIESAPYSGLSATVEDFAVYLDMQWDIADIDTAVFTVNGGDRNWTIQLFVKEKDESDYVSVGDEITVEKDATVAIKDIAHRTEARYFLFGKTGLSAKGNMRLHICSVKFSKKTAAPTCDAPTEPEVDGMDGKLMLGWKAPASAPANGYKVEYWLDGTTEKTAVPESTTMLELDSSSLTPGTYHWQVSSKCGDDLFSTPLAGADFEIPTPTTPFITPSATEIAEESTYNVAWTKSITVTAGNLTTGITTTVKSGEEGREPVISVVTDPATLDASTTSFSAQLSAAANLDVDIYEDTVVFTSGDVVAKVVVTLGVNPATMPKVVMNPNGGTFNDGTTVNVTLSVPGIETDSIYYTLDGSAPSNTKTKGTTITITEPTTVKAIAYAKNYETKADSAVSAEFKFKVVPVGDIVFEETFAKCHGGSKSDWSNGALVVDSCFDNDGSKWKDTLVYDVPGAVKVSKSGIKGYLTTPSIDLSDNGGTFYISFRARAWSGDGKTVDIVVNDEDPITVEGLYNTAPATGETYADHWDEFVVKVVGKGTANTRIKFTSKENKPRFFLDDIKV